jgi:hypothetical protein
MIPVPTRYEGRIKVNHSEIVTPKKVIRNAQSSPIFTNKKVTNVEFSINPFLLNHTKTKYKIITEITNIIK